MILISNFFFHLRKKIRRHIWKAALPQILHIDKEHASIVTLIFCLAAF